MTDILLPPLRIEGLSSTIGSYRAVILDLWGVVHDGIRVLPGAIEALVQLRNQAIPVCLLSNAPRRADVVAGHLAELGVAPTLYTHLVTSGELTFKEMRSSWNDATYFHLGPPFLAHLTEGSGCHEAATLEDADFILCTGTDRAESIDPLQPTLRTALDLELPMLCANPDREVMIGELRALCAGAIAEAYHEMGGRVRSFGKPHAQVYHHVLGLLGLTASDVLAIGDSFATDVMGANGASIDSAFVTSGIHRDLFDEAGDPLESSIWTSLTERFAIMPHYMMTRLCW